MCKVVEYVQIFQKVFGFIHFFYMPDYIVSVIYYFSVAC